MRYCPQCKQRFDNDRQRCCPRDQVRLSLPDPYRLVGSMLESKYRIEALEGIGGFGAVYYAQHTGLERQVAFKILKPDLALQMPSTVSLFESEAKTVGRLRHANIVEVFDTGRTPDGLAYLAMEWIDGVPLDEELQARGPFSLARTGEILRQIAAALAVAHTQRIIHRDLKPSNVMLVPCQEGRELVKVLDFGIAKVLSTDTGTLTSSQVSRPIGTPHYASPEQLQPNAQIDRRSDIYALGVLLYEMLTGVLPFRAGNVAELVQQKLADAPRPMRELRPELPAALDALVRRMLRCDKEQRPRHVGEIPALFAAACRSAGVAQQPALAEMSLSPLLKAAPQRQTGAYSSPFLHELADKPLAQQETKEADELPPELERQRLAQQTTQAATQAAQQETSAEPSLPPANTGGASQKQPAEEKPPNRLFNSGLLSRLATQMLGVLITLGGVLYFFHKQQTSLNNNVSRHDTGTPPLSPQQVRKVLEELESQMVALPGGTFLMGANNGEDYEKPSHRVILAPFRLGKYEVTQTQWQAVLGNNPSSFKGDNLPVENVSWNEVLEFCKKLSAITGQDYRLPTEAEWEYAARGGSTGKYNLGDEEQLLAQQAWYASNSGNQTHPVGQKKPNGFGLHDLHGNVWEWCQDLWHDSYNGAPADGKAWVKTLVNSGPRVYRGGSWGSGAGDCRSAYRDRVAPGIHNAYLGFRLARS